MAFAVSFAFGYNQQLQAASQTYPDRFFFLGGADSLRGFQQASLVPQDVAKNILDPKNPLTINEVTIRGGDAMINPRAELRIPLTATWQTAIFVDTGNLWLDAREVNPLVLRYAAGSGLRASTPIGPLALDYGINLDRRPWEDFGAFHFSIGLF
jgi:outer membrane translocation and assembly module TamA